GRGRVSTSKVRSMFTLPTTQTPAAILLTLVVACRFCGNHPFVEVRALVCCVSGAECCRRKRGKGIDCERAQRPLIGRRDCAGSKAGQAHPPAPALAPFPV